jgi:hypothetical protein
MVANKGIDEGIYESGRTHAKESGEDIDTTTVTNSTEDDDEIDWDQIQDALDTNKVDDRQSKRRRVRQQFYVEVKGERVVMAGFRTRRRRPRRRPTNSQVKCFPFPFLILWILLS